jgi:AcrR family transcriptional regulator
VVPASTPARSDPSQDPSQRPARTRLLDTARRLFYGEGIHAIGVARIAAEAGVTKATFYDHFPGKDQLVRAYLEEVHRGDVTTIEAATRHRGDPQGALLALFDVAIDRARDPGYRGCPYINAAAEYPDPAHPVRVVIEEHRAWLRDHCAALLRAAGHPEPEDAARMLVLLWDGAAVGGYFDNADTVEPAVRRAARALLTPATPHAGARASRGRPGPSA